MDTFGLFMIAVFFGLPALLVIDTVYVNRCKMKTRCAEVKAVADMAIAGYTAAQISALLSKGE